MGINNLMLVIASPSGKLATGKEQNINKLILLVNICSEQCLQCLRSEVRTSRYFPTVHDLLCQIDIINKNSARDGITRRHSKKPQAPGTTSLTSEQ